jgi:hypothetical protein
VSTVFHNNAPLSIPTSEPIASPAHASEAANNPGLVKTAAYGGSVSTQSALDVEGVQGTLATLRNPMGQRVDPFDARPTDRVNIRGSETTVAVALKMGALTRDPRTGALIEGQLREAAQATPAATADQPNATLQADLGGRAEKIRDAFLGNAPRSTVASAFKDVLNTGEINPTTINALASAMGITPEKAKGQLTELGGAMVTQRTKALGKMGIVGGEMETFLDWVDQQRPDLRYEAEAKQLTKGDLSGYQKLADAYWENLGEIDPDRVLTAEYGSGIKARKSGNTVVLQIPGRGEVSYRTAVRQGIVRVY